MRFQKRIRIAPGLRANLSFSGVSLSAGAPGATVTVGKQGLFTNFGLPGTGLAHRSKVGGSSRKRRAAAERSRGSSRSADSGSPIRLEIAVHDDGSVTFLDANTQVPLSDELISQAKRDNGAQIRQWLASTAETQNALRQRILRIQHASLRPDSQRVERTSFAEQKPTKPIPTFVGFWTKLFMPGKTKRIRRDDQLAQEQFAETLSQWTVNRKHFQTCDRERVASVEAGLRTDSRVIGDYFSDRLSAIDWPRETLVDLAVSRDLSLLVIQVDLPEIEDIPETTAAVHGSQYKLVMKSLSKKQRRLDYANHVHGIVFRIISEAFASLPTVTQVICSGYSQRRGRKTATIDDEYLLSILAAKSDWQTIDFDAIDQLDLFDYLGRDGSVRRMTSTGVFKPIEPIEPDGDRFHRFNISI